MRKIGICIFAICALIFSSCALSAVATQHTVVDTSGETITLNSLGNGKVLLYNGAGFFNKIDNTARVNVWIDGLAVGQIRVGEYAVVFLPDGKHKLKVEHIDMVKMRSEHEIDVANDTKIIEVKPTLTSNKANIVSELPVNFERYKQMPKRK
ncbi:hypothetical protein [Flavobacterium sp.]|uniref:hypothetical protein n=1 Tax=Flavobacterium sp. TaxID=239 RepID=UPI001202B618|nr:hypothetical protein [Flavobacterium sp.]RZJ69354.1 MAG: hypothetical protein EOO49_17800 [Flavobacterium sp.]